MGTLGDDLAIDIDVSKASNIETTVGIGLDASSSDGTLEDIHTEKGTPEDPSGAPKDIDTSLNTKDVHIKEDGSTHITFAKPGTLTTEGNKDTTVGTMDSIIEVDVVEL